jgi:DNA recombination protein RmuC
MTTILLVLLAAAVAFLAAWVIKKPSGDDKSMALLQQQLESLRGQLSENLKNNTDTVNKQLQGIIEEVNKQLNAVTGQMVSSQKTMGDRLDSATKAVSDVHKGLGTLSQAAERIFEVGKDISSLQEILQSPKMRGGFGEFLLGDILAQMLPKEHFELQKKFKSGETVDAVIRLGSGLVPVDSKFPLENFRRVIETANEEEKKAAKKKFVSDVKKHIDAVASKYILPDEGTFDFALMYVPAENVYYETIIKDDVSGEGLSEYALKKKVIPVSPNSFYAYIQAIVLGLKGMRIEKSAQEIIKNLARLKGDYERFKKEFDILGSHITDIKNKYDVSSKRLDNFGDKLLSTCEDNASASLPEQTAVPR